jgi:REP element-mobilizing transposase RayT
MPDTYTRLYIQLVFAVKGRQSLIHESWEEDLYRYITGIVQNSGHKMLQINGMPDHIHIFFGYNPNQRIPDLVKDIKNYSNNFVNINGFTRQKFNWQQGYGAFSYALAQKKNVIRYIENQKEHHRKESFKEEYVNLLQKFEVDYKEAYLFDFLD